MATLITRQTSGTSATPKNAPLTNVEMDTNLINLNNELMGKTSNVGTVTSVGLSLPSEFSTANSPVTTSGTLTVTKASQTAKYVFAAPNAADGVPVFRALVASDIPTLNQNTTGTAANVTGTVAIANGGTGTTTAQLALNALAGAVTTNYYLRGNGTNVVMSALAAEDLSGTVAIANGGTGATTAAAAKISLGITGGCTVSATAPSTPNTSDLWWNSSTGVLSVYYNDGDTSQWVACVGNQGIIGPTGTSGTTEISFSIPSSLIVNTGVMRWYADRSIIIQNVIATVGVAPTGASLIFDVNKNGTSIFTTQDNRPTITASGFTDLTSVPDTTTMVSGDYLTIDIDQVGSTIAGSHAVIRIRVI